MDHYLPCINNTTYGIFTTEILATNSSIQQPHRIQTDKIELIFSKSFPKKKNFNITTHKEQTQSSLLYSNIYFYVLVLETKKKHFIHIHHKYLDTQKEDENSISFHHFQAQFMKQRLKLKHHKQLKMIYKEA